MISLDGVESSGAAITRSVLNTSKLPKAVASVSDHPRFMCKLTNLVSACGKVDKECAEFRAFDRALILSSVRFTLTSDVRTYFYSSANDSLLIGTSSLHLQGNSIDECILFRH
jgi:hypothetical protein